MFAQEVAKQDSAPAITPAIRPTMPWRVTEVWPMEDFRLRVRFVDGDEGVVEMSGRVKSPAAGVFAVLADPDLFAQVFVEHGAVTWPGELDLAPDAMHDEILANGVWVLT